RSADRSGSGSASLPSLPRRWRRSSSPTSPRRRPDGVPATEILGESDPRRFAATWATERGLVAEQPPQRKRRRLWIWVTVGLAILLFVLLPVLSFVGGGHSVARQGTISHVVPRT